MATIKVFLPDTLKAWVEAQAETAGYTSASASDYVGDLVQKDQVRASKRDALQGLITEGMESGEAEHLDLGAFLSRMRARLEKAK